MMFWTRAAERPLYLAPEDERDEGLGRDYLYEYEASGRGQGDGGAAVRNADGEGGPEMGGAV